MATINGATNSAPNSKAIAGRYTLLPETARQSHVLMVYPSMASADDEEHLRAMQHEIVGIANAIARFEPVRLFTRSDLVSQASSRVDKNVSVSAACADQLWIRDSGPVYIRDNQSNIQTAVSFNFNYWGDKLPFTGDEGLAVEIAKRSNEPLLQARLRLEGGAVEHDGEGTFLATESCIINDNRNPSMAKAEIEAELNNIFGVTHFIWLPGIKGHDITDYHIDALARFTSPGKVVLSKPAHDADVLAKKAYDESRDILSKSRDAHGRNLVIYDIEEPSFSALGKPDSANEVIASYVNYLIVNNAVIMAKFNQSTDAAAFDLMKELFPDREIVQVPINMLPRTGGGIHCATQHVPA